NEALNPLMSRSSRMRLPALAWPVTRAASRMPRHAGAEQLHEIARVETFAHRAHRIAPRMEEGKMYRAAGNRYLPRSAGGAVARTVRCSIRLRISVALRANADPRSCVL